MEAQGISLIFRPGLYCKNCFKATDAFLEGALRCDLQLIFTCQWKQCLSTHIFFTGDGLFRVSIYYVVPGYHTCLCSKLYFKWLSLLTFFNVCPSFCYLLLHNLSFFGLLYTQHIHYRQYHFINYVIYGMRV